MKVKCPKCGSNTFSLIKQVTDTLVTEEDGAKVFLENVNEVLENYDPIKDCDEVECVGCGEAIPKQTLEGLKPSYEMA